MASMNHVVLLGNLTRDPETSRTDATCVTGLRLAVDRKYKTKSGEVRKDVCYVDVKAFDKLGDTCAKFLAKGRLVAVEGRLNFREWTDQRGEKRSKLEVVADRVQFLDRSVEGEGPSAAAVPDQVDLSEMPS